MGYSLKEHLFCGEKVSRTVTAYKHTWDKSIIISLLAGQLPDGAHLQTELTGEN